jgi:hypothetical protein
MDPFHPDGMIAESSAMGAASSGGIPPQSPDPAILSAIPASRTNTGGNNHEYGSYTQKEDALMHEKLFKYNHPAKDSDPENYYNPD